MEGIVGGDFRVIEKLSEGGMGSVFVVEQISTGKRRALKTMKTELAADPRFRERFTLEARVGARIESEHVVEVVGAGIDGESGAPWLAMELLDGADLATVVKRRGALPFAEVLEALKQVGHALAKAHEAGVVHRDLKPENLFVAKPRRDGIPFTIKILDFGIAKLVSDAKTNAAATGSLGTPLWMSPEQADARAAIGPAADIWPLGLIAFFALTGRYYWRTAEGPSFTALMKEVLFDPLEPPSVRAAASVLPEGFDAWFFRCVARDPGHRFASVREAIDALARSASPTNDASPLAATVPHVPPLPSPHAATALQATAPAPPPPMPLATPAAPKKKGRGIRYVIAAIAILSVVGVPALTFGIRAYGKWAVEQAAKPPGPTNEDLARDKRVAELLERREPFTADDRAAIPIDALDPAIGTNRPLVVGTLFCGWKDDECARLAAMTDEIMKKEAPVHLRVIYKHAVKRGDEDARLAAQASQGVFEAAGASGFTKFRDSLFAHRGEITRANLIAWARDAGVLDPNELGRRLDEGRWAARVDRDGDLAARIRIDKSTLFANCREVKLNFDVYLAASELRDSLLLADGQKTVMEKQLAMAASPIDSYRAACAARAEKGPINVQGVLPLVRSPYASDVSDDAAREVVIKYLAALSRMDAALLATVAADPVRVNGKDVPRAKLVLADGKKVKTPTGRTPIDVEIVADPKDTARRTARLVALTGSADSPRIALQDLVVGRTQGQWRVEEEHEASNYTPVSCADHMIAEMISNWPIANVLLEAPTRGERDAGCLTRAASVHSCTSLRCSFDVACHRVTSLETVRYFEYDREKGTLVGRPNSVADDKTETVHFEPSTDMRNACADPAKATPFAKWHP